MYCTVNATSTTGIIVVKNAPRLLERKRLAPSGLFSSSWYCWIRIPCTPTTPIGVLYPAASSTPNQLPLRTSLSRLRLFRPADTLAAKARFDVGR
ncbi:hypothetical protein D3C72_2117080 [compost metagenome]